MLPVRAIVLLILVVLAAHASAQDKGANGLTMGAPLSVGLITHLGDRFALRPELQLNFATTDTDSTFSVVRSDISLVSLGVSGLIYIGEKNTLRTYVSPRYGFSRSHFSSESPFGTTSTNTLMSHTLGISFGAQYALHDRFSVFGEAGISSTFDRRESGQTPVHAETTAVGTRGGVGVVFYF